MTERRPDEPELREVDADELAHDEVEPDPEELPGPLPDDERELPIDDETELVELEDDLDA